MNVIFVLIAFSSFVAIIFLAAYIWSVKTGQYDDNYTPSVRVLFDNEVRKNDQEKTKDEKN